MTASARHFIFDIVKLVIAQNPVQKLITVTLIARPLSSHSLVCCSNFFGIRDNSLSGARPSSVTSAIHIHGKSIAPLRMAERNGHAKWAFSNVTCGRVVEFLRNGTKYDALPVET